MKNMKISTRILFGFLIAIVLTIVLGVVSIYGLNTERDLVTRMHDVPYEAAKLILRMESKTETITKDLYKLTSASSQQELDSIKSDIETQYTELVTNSRALEEIYPEHASLTQELESVIINQAAPVSEQVMNMVQIGVDNRVEVGDVLETQYEPVLAQANSILSEIESTAKNEADAFVASAASTGQWLLILIITMMAVEAIVAILLAIYITGTIRKPIDEVVAATTEIAHGNLGIDLTYHSKDAVGSLADNVRSMAGTLKGYIDEISDILRNIANGNLDVSSKENYLGDFVEIGDSMERIIASLNSVFGNMNQAAGQVAVGANEVSRGAQALAEGSTKQSASVQELSVAINHVNDQIQHNATNVSQTTEIVGQTAKLVDTCNEQMTTMLASMSDINQSSQEISKIIKVIDDISFQTNILALNAAVEAARAGTAGQGFAVVADEVRNLATKSAEAAKETSALIEGSLQKVDVGNKNAMDTAEVLKSIVENTMKINSLVTEIGSASDEQAQSVSEINQNVEQISTVVQTNSATAEQSAAASQELSGQADMMRQMVGKFQLKDEDSSAINMDYQPSSGSHASMHDDGDKY